MIFITLLFLIQPLTDRFGDEGEHRKMPGPFDRLDKLALVARAGSRDPLGDDLSLLRDEPREAFFILVIDVNLVVLAKPADAMFSDLLILFCHGLSSLLLSRCLVFHELRFFP